MVTIDRPRIVYVTYTVPWNPRYGGAIRCRGIIEGLAEQSDLHVAFAGSTPSDIETFLKLPVPNNITRHVLLPNPGWEGVDDWKGSRTINAYVGLGMYRRSFINLIKVIKPDLNWYFEVESVRRTAVLRGVPTVLDYCDLRSRKQMRQSRYEAGLKQVAGIAKAMLLHLDDVLIATRFTRSVVASPDEIGLLWPMRNVTVLPNGYYFPSSPPPISAGCQRLLFYGSLFYKPNKDGVRWLCREVWPLIIDQMPEAQLDIAGLGGEGMSELSNIPGVNVLGFVDDLDPLIRQSAALVVPLRVGGGTRIKILEAWAKGLPVVSTNIGAEGLSIQDGKTGLIGDTTEEFAGQCISILQNATIRNQLASAGYEYGHQNFSWEIIQEQLQAICKSIFRPD